MSNDSPKITVKYDQTIQLNQFEPVTAGITYSSPVPPGSKDEDVINFIKKMQHLAKTAVEGTLPPAETEIGTMTTDGFTPATDDDDVREYLSPWLKHQDLAGKNHILTITAIGKFEHANIDPVTKRPKQGGPETVETWGFRYESGTLPEKAVLLNVTQMGQLANITNQHKMVNWVGQQVGVKVGRTRKGDPTLEFYGVSQPKQPAKQTPKTQQVADWITADNLISAATEARAWVQSIGYSLDDRARSGQQTLAARQIWAMTNKMQVSRPFLPDALRFAIQSSTKAFERYKDNKTPVEGAKVIINGLGSLSFATPGAITFLNFIFPIVASDSETLKTALIDLEAPMTMALAKYLYNYDTGQDLYPPEGAKIKSEFIEEEIQAVIDLVDEDQIPF